MIKRFAERFDGVSAFSKLAPEIQIEIGGLALEIVLAWNGQDAYENPNWSRPFHAVEPVSFDQLQDAAEDALRSLLDLEILPVPARLGQVCEVCRCLEDDACEDHCSWAAPNLCSTCEAAVSAGGPDPISEENTVIEQSQEKNN